MTDPHAVTRDGYALLRGAIPPNWLAPLRSAFDAGVVAPAQWAVPRGADWRHAQVDLDPCVQAMCRLPVVLATVGALIGARYFLAQVEGREPLAGGGHQGLHRDLSADRAGDTVNALAFLDDYGPCNGATRLVPRTHRPTDRHAPVDTDSETHALQLTGDAGDILVFDADLLHAGSCNVTGARRRSLLIGYFAETRRADHQRTSSLRSVRMETDGVFDP